jgi:phenylalanyl-tRNA synthetase beta chain
VNGKKAGVFGEVHPQVLENWGIGVPASLADLDLDTLLAN